MQWYSAVDRLSDPFGRTAARTVGRPFCSSRTRRRSCSAAVVGLLAWLWMCGLPKPYHPLFAADAVERATQDRYLLVFPPAETLTDWIETTLQPLAIHDIGTRSRTDRMRRGRRPASSLLLLASCDESMDRQNRFKTYGTADRAARLAGRRRGAAAGRRHGGAGRLSRGSREIAEPPAGLAGAACSGGGSATKSIARPATG